jgi:hypothetical protein
MKKYAIIAAVVVVAGLLIWISTSDSDSSEDSAASTTTTIPVPIEESVPTVPETDQTRAIPDPCESISIENVAKYVSPSTVRGPLVQNTSEISESCEWTRVESDAEAPRIGVSIAASTSIFDPLEADAIENVTIATKGYVINGFQTTLGGAACGRTMIVETQTFSYVVALCEADGSLPTTEELTVLANDVLNSLPADTTT